jgi:hypothetical protein
MKAKSVLCIVPLLLMLCGFLPRPVLAAPVAADAADLGNFPMAFAFADESGSRLLIHSSADHDPMAGSDPAQYTLAIGPYGKTARISFAGKQNESEANNNRQTSFNFDNLPGYVYNAKGGSLRPNETYCLTREGGLEKALISMIPPFPLPDKPDAYYPQNPELDDKTVLRIEALRGRKVKQTEKLATAFGGAQIGLVLFERLGDDMLFSIVYIEGTRRMLFWDCPAVYDEISTWRVDMGDEPGSFQIIFLAQLGDRLAMLLEWGAPEGASILLLHEDNGGFKQAESTYSRYWAPD